jgi:hypothetical protein
MQRRRLAALCAAITVACAKSDAPSIPSGGEWIVRDSAGITIVESTKPLWKLCTGSRAGDVVRMAFVMCDA